MGIRRFYTDAILLETVTRNPGLTTRGVTKRIGASLGMDEQIRDRLLGLAERGRLRCEQELLYGDIYMRRWYPVEAVKE